MKIQDLTPHLLYQFKTEHELIEAIEKISSAFTVERHRLSDYLNDPKLVTAYTLFYLSTNMPKLKACLEMARLDLRSKQLVEVGAGPGTFSLAWLELFGGEQVVQWESSKLMQEQSMKLMKHFYPETKLILNRHMPFSNKVLLFGHSMNEMGVDEALKYIKVEEPEMVIFIEPGTKEVFSQMLEIRSSLIQNEFKAVYPCLGQGQCPMQGTENWCHQYLDVRHDSSVERLTQLVKKDRRNLPIIFHVYQKSQPEVTGARIVRVLPETKYSFEFEVCQANLKLERWQVMKKNYSKDEQKQISKLKSGMLLVDLEKEMKGVYFRVKI